MEWSVGHSWLERGPDASDFERWSSDVQVSLEFDDNNRPTCFKCCRDGIDPRTKRAFEAIVVDLSQEAMVTALRQLHPAGSY
jgi:hypothetical protein